MRAYVIQAGDSFDALCARRGANAEETWNAAENEELRALRSDRHMLLAGDVVHLPEPVEEPVELEAETTNRYTATVPTTRVQLQLREGEAPVGGTPFVVLGTEPPIEGSTDGDGRLEIEVPVTRREIVLHFTERESHLRVRLGELDPPDTESGAVHRLRNLGFLHDAHGQTPTAAQRAQRLEGAVLAFQRSESLTETGELDEDTTRALERRHDS